MKIYKTAEFIHKRSSFEGEWWIVDGVAEFADGDVGDLNHEAYTIEHARYLLAGDPDEWDEWKITKAYEIAETMKMNARSDKEIATIRERVEADNELFLLEEMGKNGIDEETFFVANGNHRDPRLFSMKKWGWKRMARRNIMTWTLTGKDLREIASGIESAYGDDIFDMENIGEEAEFTIEVLSTRKTYWNVPFSRIEANVEDLAEYANKYSSSTNAFLRKDAQHSSIMYVGSNNAYNIYEHSVGPVFLTPSQYVAKQDKDFVLCYKIKKGNYYSIDFILSNPKTKSVFYSLYGRKIKPSDMIKELISNKRLELANRLIKNGCDGFFSGDYICVFDRTKLEYLGVYDIYTKTISIG